MRTLIDKIKRWIEGFSPVQAYWLGSLLFVLIAIVVIVVLSILSTVKDVSNYKLDSKNWEFQEEQILVTQAEEEVIVEELKKLKDEEVLIIKTHKNEAAQIFTIPADSLQYYADSLYNRP